MPRHGASKSSELKFLHWARRCAAPLLLVVLSFVSGCGAITGRTTQQTVQLDNLSLPEFLVPVTVESFTSAPDAGELHTSGVYRWGKFDEADLTNLRVSLERTLNAAVGQHRLDESEVVRVHVIIRKYIVASSNSEIGALAAVDWCAALGSGNPLYGEVFYSANQSQLASTLGAVKDNVHRAIVGRIAESSLLLAARGDSAPTLPQVTDGTFDQLEDALNTLPESVASAGYALVAAPFYISGSSPVTIPWRSADVSRSFSCDEFLARN